MHFDVPKLVRSPGCEHRHNEESRNGRDIKIDILDDYIRTPELFRVISEKTGVPEGVPEPPGEVLGLSGPEGRERAAAQEVAPPPRPSPNWTRGRGCASFFLPFSLPLPCLLLLLHGRTPSWTRKGGILLPVGVGLPPWCAPLGRRPPPPWLLYIRGRGAPHRHTS